MLATAGASTWEPTVPVQDYVHVKTYVAAEKQWITFPRGVLVGVVGVYTGKLKAWLTLPPASSPVDIAGIGLATATTRTVLTKPITGVVNVMTSSMTSTSSSNIFIQSIVPSGTNVNLVPAGCVTSTPIVMTISGKVKPFGPATYTTKFTIPPFKNCGVLTTVINQMIPGPNNIFTAVFNPNS